MGGDDAPRQVVEGALFAVESDKDLECILVGNTDAVRASLEKHGPVPERISIVHAESIIEMDDAPVESLKRKQNSSIFRTVELVKAKEAAGLVAAGNTGAVVASTMMGLKMISGVRRAGIAAPIPTRHGTCLLIDVGANVNCKPEHLLQYGVMAATYSKTVLDIPEPTIGLLSIGKEGQKGNELVKETHKLFMESDLNFKGNVEGQRLFQGEVDVVVCEGFVGNVIIKTTEGYGENLLYYLTHKAEEIDPENKYKNFRERFHDVFKTCVDYSFYGGAPLLGVDGVCIICHGRSNARAIATAIGVAKRYAANRTNEHIQHEILQLDRTTKVS
jgi:glycerol-3-phosphate acyltransferase PlsX